MLITTWALLSQDFVFKKANEVFKRQSFHCLIKNCMFDPYDISVAAISLLKFETSLQKQLKLGDDKVIQTL